MVPASSNPAPAGSPADHMSGLQSRMRVKQLDKGGEALSEVELLEMLLYAGKRRGDTKPLAKALMQRFGSLSSALRAPAALLVQQSDMGDGSVPALKIVEATELKTALSLVTITLHDHLIVTSKSVLSFKSLGLL